VPSLASTALTQPAPENRMTQKPQGQPRPFSLVRGGLFYRFERRFGLVREEPPDPAARIWGAILFTFLPLVVLAAIQGVLIGSRVTLPLVLDLTIWTRFVIAIPLLLRAERNIDGRLSSAVQHFRSSGLVPEEARADLEAAIARTERARDSLVPESILILGSLVLGWLNSHAVLSLPVSSWRVVTPGDLFSTTLAGHWLDFVSLPIFNFLVYRWLWRIVLWTILLWRISRLPLSLPPTHPDGSAGLGFLGGIHAVFGAFLVPISASVAARGAQWVQYGGGSLEAFRNGAIAYAVLALVIALGPLLVFMPKLMMTKRRALLDYNVLALEYTRRFDHKWVRGGRGDEELLGTADIQSLADLANSFGIVKSLRILPPSTKNVIPLLSAVVLPMVPFLAVIIPIEQILKQLAQLVLR
jgi:hypothetical protein